MVLSRPPRFAFSRIGFMRTAFPLTRVAVGVLTAIGAMSTQALQFQTDDVDITFTTQITVGGSWRAGDADKDLIAGPNIEGDTDFSDNASSSVADDGNANYGKG